MIGRTTLLIGLAIGAAEAVAQAPVPGAELAGQWTALGFLLWYAWYLTARVGPRRDSQFLSAVSALMQSHAEDRATFKCNAPGGKTPAAGLLLIAALLFGGAAAGTPTKCHGQTFDLTRLYSSHNRVNDVNLLDGKWEHRSFLLDATPLERGNQVRAVLAVAKPGQTVQLALEVYDFGAGYLLFPPGVKVRGVVDADGLPVTELLCQWRQSALANAFELSDQSVVEDLKLTHNLPDGGYQGQCVGFGLKSTPLGAHASLRNVTAVGRGGFCLYVWYSAGSHLLADRCRFGAGRWVVAAANASETQVAGPRVQALTLVDCEIEGDAAKYGLGGGGDQGQVTLGAVVRGGAFRMIGGKITVKGFAGTGKPGDNNAGPFDIAACLAATNQGSGAATWGKGKWPTADLVDVVLHTEANGVKQAADVIEVIGQATVTRGAGSGPNGAVTTIGPVQVDGAGQYAIAP